jgi:hypothetical protein
MFLRCVDERYYAWREEVLGKVAGSSTIRQRRLKFLTTDRREIEKAIETNEKNLDKYFLYLRIPDERLSPWTGLPSSREIAPPRPTA